MDLLGIHWGYVFLMLFNLLLLGGWLVLAVFTLFRLRQSELTETTRALWAALILLVPIGGALAFWIVRPGGQFPDAFKSDDEF